ncbi:hypothetical protein GCM10025859_49760 [Alicyclobacillus fastidiosus]|nr:hypothetical protein GCM10025859_49760 [Alicyclobacillus fastidiosus]
MVDLNSEDRLNVLWAKKTAIQLMKQSGSNKISFGCPICSDKAQMNLIDQRYESFCQNGCFKSID